MNWIPFILFVALPLTVAIFTGFIFARVPFIKLLRTKAALYDKEQLTIAPNPISLKALRDHQHIGDKTVVVHHLSSLTRDVERKLRNGFLEASILSALTVVLIAVVIIPMQLNQQANQQRNIVAGSTEGAVASDGSRTPATQDSPDQISLYRGLILLFKQVPIFFLIPVGEFVAVIRAVLIVFFLQDQASKFSDLLDDPI